MSTATKLANELLEERQKFAKWYDESKDASGTFSGDISEFRKRNDALNELASKYRDAAELDAGEKSNADGMAALMAPQERLVKGGEMFPGHGPAPAEVRT
ncbi:MAG: hypothetical protein JO246_06715, partial [Frankiaceae bacterium]|nr:hypothetical protein [Frankiaceae bacterium]